MLEDIILARVSLTRLGLGILLEIFSLKPLQDIISYFNPHKADGFADVSCHVQPLALNFTEFESEVKSALDPAA